MSTATAVVTMIGVVVAVLTPLVGGLVFLGRGIWRMSTRAHELHSAVKDNTKATTELAGEFRSNKDDVLKTLTDHEHRITTLETRQSP